MPTKPKTLIRLYENRDDIANGVPYATISQDELALATERYYSWAVKLATYPNSAVKFGETKTSHIQLATDLRAAMKAVRWHHNYLTVVFPMSKYFAAMSLLAISRSVEPQIAELIEQENQRWVDEFVI